MPRPDEVMSTQSQHSKRKAGSGALQPQAPPSMPRKRHSVPLPLYQEAHAAEALFPQDPNARQQAPLGLLHHTKPKRLSGTQRRHAAIRRSQQERQQALTEDASFGPWSQPSPWEYQPAVPLPPPLLGSVSQSNLIDNPDLIFRFDDSSSEDAADLTQFGHRGRVSSQQRLSADGQLVHRPRSAAATEPPLLHESRYTQKPFEPFERSGSGEAGLLRSSRVEASLTNGADTQTPVAHNRRLNSTDGLHPISHCPLQAPSRLHQSSFRFDRGQRQAQIMTQRHDQMPTFVPTTCILWHRFKRAGSMHATEKPDRTCNKGIKNNLGPQTFHLFSLAHAETHFVSELIFLGSDYMCRVSIAKDAQLSSYSVQPMQKLTSFLSFPCRVRLYLFSAAHAETHFALRIIHVGSAQPNMQSCHLIQCIACRDSLRFGAFSCRVTATEDAVPTTPEARAALEKQIAALKQKVAQKEAIQCAALRVEHLLPPASCHIII